MAANGTATPRSAAKGMSSAKKAKKTARAANTIKSKVTAVKTSARAARVRANGDDSEGLLDNSTSSVQGRPVRSNRLQKLRSTVLLAAANGNAHAKLEESLNVSTAEVATESEAREGTKGFLRRAVSKIFTFPESVAVGIPYEKASDEKQTQQNGGLDVTGNKTTTTTGCSVM